MSYKLKSALYFTCFVASAVMYYNMNNNLASMDKQTEQIAEVVMNDVPTLEVTEVEDSK